MILRLLCSFDVYRFCSCETRGERAEGRVGRVTHMSRIWVHAEGKELSNETHSTAVNVERDARGDEHTRHVVALKKEQTNGTQKSTILKKQRGTEGEDQTQAGSRLHSRGTSQRQPSVNDFASMSGSHAVGIAVCTGISKPQPLLLVLKRS